MRPAHAFLSQLVVNPEINPRHDTGDVSDIVAQIEQNGFNDRLMVRAVGDIYEVIDGSRRLAALTQLRDAGKWDDRDQIAVDVIEADDGQAREIALAAAVTRADLSPADESLGFYRLKLSGETEDQIAARFAVPVRRVRQRIAIGSLPAKILDALRRSEIKVETAEAFTLSPSAERQLEVFDMLSQDRGRAMSSWNVRQAIINEAVDLTDYRARFVGAEAYEEAGGVVTRDLFSANAWFGDGALLQRLFDDKLEATVQALKDEGWSWVEVAHRDEGWSGEVLKPKGKRILTEVEGERIAAIRARMEEIDRASTELQGLDEWTDKHRQEEEQLVEESADLEDELAALEERPFTRLQMKKSGVKILFSHYGDARIYKGLVKPVKGEKPTKASEDAADPDEAEAPEEGWPDALHVQMAVAARDAVKLALAQVKPALAARMGLAARICEVTGFGSHGPFTTGRTDWPHDHLRLHAYGSRLLARFHGCDFAETLAVLETQTPEQIVQLEALMTAMAFQCNSLANSDVRAVIEMVDPDMTAEGFAVGEEFLKRLNRQQLDAIISECSHDPLKASAKKVEAVSAAAVAADATGWLPPQMRTPSYTGPGSNAWADRQSERIADIINQQAAE